jgi:hypothetical protein
MIGGSDRFGGGVMSRDERRMTVVEDNSKANCRAWTPGFLWYPPVDPFERKPRWPQRICRSGRPRSSIIPLANNEQLAIATADGRRLVNEILRLSPRLRTRIFALIKMLAEDDEERGNMAAPER